MMWPEYGTYGLVSDKFVSKEDDWLGYHMGHNVLRGIVV